MEGIIRHSRILFLSLFAIPFAGSLFAQSKDSAITKLVETRQYVFHARTALPSAGASRQLTSEYDLKVFNDSLVSYLPYFGRAYSASYGSTNSGLQFTSTQFDYKVSKRKKGGWQISIKPKDVQDVREFLLTIAENGYGNLQALSNNRQPISFTGYISARQ